MCKTPFYGSAFNKVVLTLQLSICTNTAEESSISTFCKRLHPKASFNSFTCHSESTLAEAHPTEVQLNLETSGSLTTSDCLFSLLASFVTLKNIFLVTFVTKNKRHFSLGWKKLRRRSSQQFGYEELV